MEERFIPFTDEIFKYTGVWQSDNGKEIISYHTAAQLEFGFKGDTIKLKAKLMKKKILIIMNIIKSSIKAILNTAWAHASFLPSFSSWNVFANV